MAVVAALIIASTTACSVLPERQIKTVEVKTIPVLPAPVKIEVPPAPNMQLPDPVIVINNNEASFYLDACEDYRFAGEEGYDSLEEVQADYPGLSQDDACNFNIYGWTLQGWLNFESKMAELAGYVETLRSHIQFLENQMDARYELMKERDETLKQGVQSQKHTSYTQDDN